MVQSSSARISQTSMDENMLKPVRKSISTQLICAFIALQSASIDAVAVDASAKRPNIVLILIDDMGWKDFGEAGSTYYETPNIDQLSREGVRFMKGYSAAPVCSPSRGALLSGQFPARTKFTTVFGKDNVDTTDTLHKVAKAKERANRKRYNNKLEDALHYQTLPITKTTFGDVLKRNDYNTGYLGKWHSGYSEKYWPSSRGFDYAEGFRMVPGTTPHFGEQAIGLVAGMDGIKPEDHFGDKLTDKAVKYIYDKAKETKPFMLVLSHYLVHGPLKAKPEYIAHYKNKPTTDQANPIFAAMIQSVDESVGRVLQAISDNGIDENTVVIFTSDNGGVNPNTSPYPLLGGKSHMFEAGMRVPFLVRWKGEFASGVDTTHRVIQTDIFPTLLDIAGIRKEPSLHKDGKSFYPLLTKNENWSQSPIFFHFPHYTHATSPATALIDNDWKLIRFYNDAEGDQDLLFNLKDDPYEQNDLSGSNKKKLNEMVRLMQSYLTDTQSHMPQPNPDFDPTKSLDLGKKHYYDRAQREREVKKKLYEESVKN
jgi:arylsulfatase A